MDYIILALSIICIALSCACIYMIISIKRSMDQNDNSNDKVYEQLDALKESIYNEFSRNRSEQNQTALAQRQEISNKIQDVSKNLEKLNNTWGMDSPDIFCWVSGLYIQNSAKNLCVVFCFINQQHKY